MRTWNRKAKGLNSVACAAGEFRFPTVSPVEMEPMVTLTMVYLNDQTFHTYGQCPMGSSLMSEATLEALKHFMELAEKDFVGIISDGVVDDEPAEDTSQPGLRPLGGG